MGDYTVDDPELVEKITVDREGRIYLGKKHANKQYRVILESIEDTEE